MDDETTNIGSSAPVSLKAEARMVALTGPNMGRAWAVGSDIVVGRSRTTNIRLDDPDVSRKHLRVYKVEEDDWRLEDLGSRNGTLLNGTDAYDGALRFGDRIQVGSTVLQFTRTDQLEDDLQQSQRMEALGRLAGGIAHDFNNLIVVVLGNLNYLQTRLVQDPNPEVTACLTDAEKALARMSELTDQLLGFARRGKYEERWLDLSELVDEAVRLCRRTFDRGIVIETDLEENIGVVGDPSQLMQVLVNLCLNARDAVDNKGTLRLSTSRALPEQLAHSSFSPDNHGRYVLVQVSDDGTGMEEETVRRVFEPFFTTKRRGTGLGLSMVYGIVNSHHGHIHVDSTPGEGTTFSIYLPEAGPRPAPSFNSIRTSRPPEATARILLVEDEELLRRTTARLLQSFGYSVLIAKDGEQGLAMFDKHRDGIDLVLLDLIMPVLDGAQAFDALQERGIEVPILLTTGHAEEDRARGLLERGAQLLRKPHDARTLRRAITRALGEEDA